MPADLVSRTDGYCSVQCRNIVDHRREAFAEAAEMLDRCVRNSPDHKAAIRAMAFELEARVKGEQQTRDDNFYGRPHQPDPGDEEGE